MQPNADSLHDSSALVASLRTELREYRDALVDARREMRGLVEQVRELRGERDALQLRTGPPGTHDVPNGDAGDVSTYCDVCGSVVDEPHPWERCALESARERDNALGHVALIVSERDALQLRIDSATSDEAAVRALKAFREVVNENNTRDMRAAIAAALAPQGGE
jgi:hypothetical protein